MSENLSNPKPRTPHKHRFISLLDERPSRLPCERSGARPRGFEVPAMRSEGEAAHDFVIWHSPCDALDFETVQTGRASNKSDSKVLRESLQHPRETPSAHLQLPNIYLSRRCCVCVGASFGEESHAYHAFVVKHAHLGLVPTGDKCRRL